MCVGGGGGGGGGGRVESLTRVLLRIYLEVVKKVGIFSTFAIFLLKRGG